MNRAYRLVFNRALGVVQVASELADGAAAGEPCGAPARSPRARMLAVLLALLLASPLAANAATVNWGGTTGDWSDPAMWVGNALPGVGDDVSISGLGSAITVGASATVNSLTVSGSGQHAIHLSTARH